MSRLWVSHRGSIPIIRSFVKRCQVKSIAGFLSMAVWMPIFYFAAYEVDRKVCSPINAMISIMAIVSSSKSAAEYMALIPSTQNLIRSTNAVSTFLQPELQNEGIQERPTQTSNVDFQGSIRFRNVSFSYPSRPNTRVLKDVSFDIPAGSTVAFVGQSGCGLCIWRHPSILNCVMQLGY